MGKYKTSREIAEGLKKQLGYDRTQSAIAKELGVSVSYLSDFLSGNREAGPKILTALGYETTPIYRKARALHPGRK